MKSNFNFGHRVFAMLLTCMALLVGGSAFAQTAKGKVIDANGEPIIGASVVQAGTQNGVVTGLDGTFELKVAPNTPLEVSCIGYVSQIVNAAANLVITLEEDSEMLAETVVVGYGVMKKTDVTGSMVSVSASQLTANPVNNAVEALQGKAAGVYITSNERPGQVGSITVRGVNSQASQSPLIVIDGIVSRGVGMDSLNPQDIESIEVLKDASATAIYGAMGGNGVVLVTTKRGSSGRFSLNYSGTATFETIADVVPMMNAQEYIDWRRWGFYYAGLGPRADEPTLVSDRALFTNYGDDPTAWGNILKGWGLTYDQWANGATSSTWDGSKVTSTDWTKYTDRVGITQEHSLSASGGTDKMHGYVSFGYLNNQGTTIGQDYKRYTLRTSFDVTPVKWLTMGGSLMARYSDQQYGIDNGNGISSNIPSSLHAKGRNIFSYALPYDADGNRVVYPGGDTTIPTVVDEVGKSQLQNLRLDLTGNVYAQLNFGDMWQPLKGLTFKTTFGPQFSLRQSYKYLSADSVNRVSQGLDFVSSNATKNFAWTLDNILSYNRVFGKHSVNGTLLQEAMANMSTQLYNMSGTGVALGMTQSWWGLDPKTVTSLNSPSYNSLSENQLASYMARVSYGYDNKYLVTASYRMDGASQLGDGHKWQGFPSFSLGWRIDQENFMKGADSVDQLKLRAGWGLTGNYSVDNYFTKDVLSSAITVFGDQGSTSYYTPTTFANNAIGWETTQQYNVGVDFSFFHGRLSGVIDLFQNYTNGLIFSVKLPSVSGRTDTKDNVGKTSNHGFDFTLSTVNVARSNFNWRSDLSLSYVKDKIVELQNGKEDMVSSGLFIGQPLSVLYGYKSLGLWSDSPEDLAEMQKFNDNGHAFKPGMVRPADLNGDYKIDSNYDRMILGTTRPLWNFGFTNTFTYKNLELSIFMIGNFGFMAQTGQYQGGREPVISMNYYNENNKTGAVYQRPYFNTAGGDSFSGILLQKDASFIKVRQIALGYNLPKKAVQAIGLNSIKITAQAKNPFSIFQNVDWMDADVNNVSFNRGFVLGLNVGF